MATTEFCKNNNDITIIAMDIVRDIMRSELLRVITLLYLSAWSLSDLQEAYLILKDKLHRRDNFYENFGVTSGDPTKSISNIRTFTKYLSGTYHPMPSLMIL